METRDAGDDEGGILLYPAYMARINEMCDNDSTIQEAEDKLGSLVYDSDQMPWAIAWGEGLSPLMGSPSADARHPIAPDSTEAFFPYIYNTGDFRHGLKRIALRLRELCRRFRFSAFWYYDDAEMVKWWREYLTNDEEGRSNMRMPCGPIPMHLATFREKERSKHDPFSREITVHCPTEDMKGYKIGIFNEDMVLIPIPREMKNLAAATNNVNTETVMVPKSPFFKLCADYDRIEEAWLNRMNAESMNTRPFSVIQTKAPTINQQVVNSISERTLFNTEGVMEAAHKQVEKPQLYTLAKAKEIWDGIEEELSGRGGFGGLPAIKRSELQREYYGRPHLFENTKPLPEMMQVGYVNKPTVVNDVCEMEDRFKDKVASLFQLPLGMLQSTGSAVKATATSEQLNDDRLMKVVAQERVAHKRIVSHLLQTVFRNIDMAGITALIEMLEASRTRKADRAAQRELLSVLQHGEGDEAAAADTEAAETEEKKKKITLKHLRRLLARMQTTGRGGASLVFQEPLTAGAVDMLRVGLDLADRHLIDHSTLEPYAQKAMGRDVRLRDPMEYEEGMAALAVETANAEGSGGGGSGPKAPKRSRPATTKDSNPRPTKKAKE